MRANTPKANAQCHVGGGCKLQGTRTWRRGSAADAVRAIKLQGIISHSIASALKRDMMGRVDGASVCTTAFSFPVELEFAPIENRPPPFRGSPIIWQQKQCLTSLGRDTPGGSHDALALPHVPRRRASAAGCRQTRHGVTCLVDVEAAEISFGRCDVSFGRYWAVETRSADDGIGFPDYWQASHS